MKPHIRKLLSSSLTSVETSTATTSPSPPAWSPWTLTEAPSTGPYKFSIVLAVLAVLTIALFFLGFLSICIRRFSDSPAAESRRRGRLSPYRTSSFPTSEPRSWSYRRSGLDPAKIQALPVYPHGRISDQKYYENMDCAICLGEFQEKETIKVIPFCKHVFHPHCIDTWLSSHMTCPVCRATRLFDDKNGGRSTVGNHDTSIEVGAVA